MLTFRAAKFGSESVEMVAKCGKCGNTIAITVNYTSLEKREFPELSVIERELFAGNGSECCECVKSGSFYDKLLD